jgi:glycerol-3-phosphate dehydrogenase
VSYKTRANAVEIVYKRKLEEMGRVGDIMAKQYEQMAHCDGTGDKCDTCRKRELILRRWRKLRKVKE